MKIMQSKCAVIVVFTAVIVYATFTLAATSKPIHDYIAGKRDKYDRLIVLQNLFAPGKANDTVTLNVTFPGLPFYKINMIMVLNNKEPGNITNIQDGAGYFEFSCLITSKKAYSLDYELRVYAIRYN